MATKKHAKSPRSRRKTAHKGKRPRSRKKTNSKPRRNGWGLLFKVTLVLLLMSVLYAVWLDVRIQSAFEGQRWSVPARIYARPLELYPGMRLQAREFERELRLIGYQPVETVRRAGQFSRSGGRYVVHTHGFDFWDGNEAPHKVALRFSDEGLEDINSLGNDSVPLLRLEPAVIGRIHPSLNEDRILVRLEDVPETLVQALLVSEDRDFYSHSGISVRGILRALWANLRAGEALQGGSTLTQQLVKNYFLSHERSLTRKLNEAAMALLLERRYSKDEILQAYLNEVFLGQAGGRAIHGFGLASLHYFARPLHELELHEVALLVALVRGASYYNPRRHPQRATDRRNRVIDQMQAAGMITAEQASRGKSARLGVTKKPADALSRYPGFVELVRRQLKHDYEAEDLQSEGLQIHTTLDPTVQAAAEAAMARLDTLEKQVKLPHGALQGAIVVASPRGGEVQALVPGRAVKESGFNRALDAKRQVGSVIKPAVYLTALGPDGGYHAASRLLDQALHIDQPDGSTWSPQNYDRHEHGVVSLHQALVNSWNLATIRLGMDVGLRKVLYTLARLGIDADLPAFPSLTLGAVDLSPLQVTQMYQTLANGGFRSSLRAIREVTDANGDPLKRYNLTVEQAFDGASVYVLNSILQEAFRRGTGRSVYKRLPGRPPMAGKTGTTDDLRDSWFAGFGNKYLAVVWLGRDDAKSAGLTGSAGALQVWGDLMTQLRPEGWNQPVPEEVDWLGVDDRRGVLSEPDCAALIQLPFIKSRRPEFESCKGW